MGGANGPRMTEKLQPSAAASTSCNCENVLRSYGGAEDARRRRCSDVSEGSGFAVDSRLMEEEREEKL